MEKAIVHRNDLVYPDLSYEVIGSLFNVYNELGYGLEERNYQKAVALELKKRKINYIEQLYVPVKYEDQLIGKQYIDFLIENKVVLEIKKGDRFAKKHIDQVLKYLKVNKYKLGILAYFSPRKLHYKRIVNFDVVNS